VVALSALGGAAPAVAQSIAAPRAQAAPARPQPVTATGRPAHTAPSAVLDRASAALKTSPVYVDPTASPTLTPSQAGNLRSQVSNAGTLGIYIAVLPAAAAHEAGRAPLAVVRALHQNLNAPGTYAAVVGGRAEAASSDLPAGESGQLIQQAMQDHPGALLAALTDFVGRVAVAERVAAAPKTSSHKVSSAVLIPIAAIIIAAWVALRLRHSSRERRQLAALHELVEHDLASVADDVDAVQAALEPAGGGEAADAARRAAEHLAAARAAFQQAARPQDIEAVTAELERARYALTCARAWLQDREPPDRRPPCFFDPGHGPSVGDVDWAPPGGEPRPVPACAADAERVQRGEDPEARQVLLGGHPTPYWNAPGFYGPWARGFFGDHGDGLLPELFMGSLLGGGMGYALDPHHHGEELAPAGSERGATGRDDH
jgi:hypothetical protein